MSRPIPIRFRLAGLFAAGTALLIGVGGTVFVNELSGGLTNSVANAIESRAALIANAGREQLATALEKSRSSNGPSGFAQLLSSTGAVLGSSGTQARIALLSSAAIAHLSKEPLLLRRTISEHEDSLLYVERIPGRHGILVVGASLQDIDEALEGVERSLIIGGPIAVALTGIAGYLLAGAALRPVEQMRRQAAAVSEHDDGTMLDIPRTRDEVAALAQTLNQLLARLQGALGRQRGFVSSAGHELRTPLANLKLELELAARPGRTATDLAEAIAEARDEVDRLAKLTDRLLLLAQSDEHAEIILPRRTNVVPVVCSAIESFSSVARERGIDVCLNEDVSSSIEADVDEIALRQVLENVLDNALSYAPSGTRIKIAVHTQQPIQQNANTGTVAIEVLDEGPGFPPEFLPRAFERFSRPDGGRTRQGGGAGLGLAIVKVLVEAHGGQVSAANRPEGGALVGIRLPITIQQPGRGSPQ